MYCKYCGNRITENTTRCVSCGSTINMNDGGQSFFDDNELTAWQSDNNTRASMPRTEMIEQLPKRVNLQKGYKEKSSKSKLKSETKRYSSRKRSKKKKNILSYFNLSGSSKLIIFCVVSALAVVLLVVAVISVFDRDDNKGRNNENDNAAVTGNVNPQTVLPDKKDAEKEGANETEDETSEEPESGREEKEDKTNVDLPNDMKIAEGVEIVDKAGELIEHEAPMFFDKSSGLYVSADVILTHIGYDLDKADSDNKYIYREKTNGKNHIQIIAGTNEIIIIEDADAPKPKKLKSKSFEYEDTVYVKAIDFLKAIGHEESSYSDLKLTIR